MFNLFTNVHFIFSWIKLVMHVFRWLFAWQCKMQGWQRVMLVAINPVRIVANSMVILVKARKEEYKRDLLFVEVIVVTASQHLMLVLFRNFKPVLRLAFLTMRLCRG